METKKMSTFLGLALLCLVMTVAIAPVAAHTPQQAFTVNLIAGQHYDAGDIKVWGNDTHVFMNITTENNWKITELHIEVATDCNDIPRTPNGKNFIPGHFEYSRTFDPAVTTIGPLVFEQPSNGTTQCIAVHAVVIQTDGQQRILNEETAWGASWKACFI